MLSPPPSTYDLGEGGRFITQPEEANFRQDSFWESYKPGSLE